MCVHSMDELSDEHARIRFEQIQEKERQQMVRRLERLIRKMEIALSKNNLMRVQSLLSEVAKLFRELFIQNTRRQAQAV